MAYGILGVVSKDIKDIDLELNPQVFEDNIDQDRIKELNHNNNLLSF